MARSTAPSRCPDVAPAERQRGVALIASLTVLAIAVATATAMTYGVHVNTRRTQNVLAAEQAWLYARTAEPATIALLGLDRERGDIDYAADGLEREPWFTASPIPKQLPGGALLRFAVADLQGRFNLNSVAGGDADGTDGADPARAQLERLIARAGIPQSGVAEPAVALADWIDADIEPRFPGGAEDDIYTRRSPPYRAANHPLVDPTELRRVAGMEGDAGAALWNALCPVVTALPEAATAINVNTASAPVLASLADGLDEAAATAAVEQREDAPYTDVEDFLARNQAFALPELDTGRLTVASRYFLVHARVTLDRARVDLYSVIHRPAEGPMAVVYRSRAAPQPARTGEGGDGAPASCVGARLAF